MRPTTLPLAALLTVLAACDGPDEPVENVPTEDPERPDAPDLPDLPDDPDGPVPEPDPEPDPLPEPDPEPDPLPEPEPTAHMIEGVHAWTLHRTVDPNASNCIEEGWFTDLAWISGFVDGAWMQRLESYPGAPLHPPVWCDREDDEIICESDAGGVPTSHGVLPAQSFLQVAPADDGSATLTGVELTEVEYAPGSTCQIAYDLQMVKTPSQPLEPLGCASESVLSAQSNGVAALVWVDGNPDHDVQVFTLDEAGERVFLMNLQQSYGAAVAVTGGSPLVVARADTGDCLEVYIAGDGLQHTSSGSPG